MICFMFILSINNAPLSLSCMTPWLLHICSPMTFWYRQHLTNNTPQALSFLSASSNKHLSTSRSVCWQSIVQCWAKPEPRGLGKARAARGEPRAARAKPEPQGQSPSRKEKARPARAKPDPRAEPRGQHSSCESEDRAARAKPEP